MTTNPVADVIAAIHQHDNPIEQMRKVCLIAREHDTGISRKWVEGWADQWEADRLAQPQPGAGSGDALDAARYRWLRDPKNDEHARSLISIAHYGGDAYLPDGTDLDAAIDAAMREAGGA